MNITLVENKIRETVHPKTVQLGRTDRPNFHRWTLTSKEFPQAWASLTAMKSFVDGVWEFVVTWPSVDQVKTPEEALSLGLLIFSVGYVGKWARDFEKSFTDV